MRVALWSYGMDVSKYSGHSFRICAATATSTVGVEDSLIKTLHGSVAEEFGLPVVRKNPTRQFSSGSKEIVRSVTRSFYSKCVICDPL